MTEQELIEAFTAATLKEQKNRDNIGLISKEIETKAEELNKLRNDWNTLHNNSKSKLLSDNAKIAMQLQDLWLQETK